MRIRKARSFYAKIRRISRASLGLLLGATSARAKTLSVGPAGTYTKPCQAIAAASDGDTIEIDAAGSYAGDVCSISASRLTIRGIGAGRPKIDAAGKSAQGKAIWVVQGNDTTIENIEFSGATVADMNGAALRQEGKNLSVRSCFFHDNQDGILAGDVAASEILIEYSEFDHNGAGDGYSHNLYINHVAKLTFRYNYSHRALVGHLLKSRAAENYVLYNRLTGESDGTQSYELDLPNGGKSFVIGNLFEQAASSQNPAIIAYLEEGTNALNPSDALFVVNNSFVNHLGRGTFVNIGAAAQTSAVLLNNVFFGGGTPTNQARASASHNYNGNAPGFANSDAYDLRLTANSPCIDAGSDPGSALDFVLTPTEQYRHPSASEARPSAGLIDIGAYEYASAAGGIGASTGGAAAQAGAASASGGSAGSAGAEAPGTAASPSSGCSCRTVPARSDDSAFTSLVVALAVAARRRAKRAR